MSVNDWLTASPETGPLLVFIVLGSIACALAMFLDRKQK